MNTRELKRRVAAAAANMELLEGRRMFSTDVPRDVIGVLHQDVWDVASDAATGNTNELVTQGAARKSIPKAASRPMCLAIPPRES